MCLLRRAKTNHASFIWPLSSYLGADEGATARAILTYIYKVEIKPHWKPTEFQMGALSDAIIHYKNEGIIANGLKELLEQLKKLREE